MAILDKIKQMLGVSEIPAEITHLYRDARNEREALILIKEARRRDETRRRRAMRDIEELDAMEADLLEEGKEEISETRKLMLARRIKELRWKIQELNNRIENIYSKRLRIFSEHIQSLETVMELSSEELPDKQTMEDMAIKAKNLLEELDHTKELAEGIAMSEEKPIPDSEETEILKEFEKDKEPEQEEKKDPARDELEKDKDIEAQELKLPEAEEKKEEAPKKEEPPEILFEE
ncbi:MAG: hypothetical protein ACYTAF_16500 [Planctomycetota bacterium]|jgi:hypothetical protein